MIQAKVEEKAPKTKEYMKYILTKFIERAPLKEKEIIEVDINENSTPFPKIIEISDYYPDGKWVNDDVDMRSERRLGKSIALQDYTNKELYMKCALLMGGYNPTEEFSATLPFVIINPEKIYDECKKYGISLPHTSDFLSAKNPNVAELVEKPTRILWRDREIPIDHSTIQEDVCKYAFSKNIGEYISWDEVIERMDKAAMRDQEKARDSIYNAVHDINKKVKNLCSEPLFRWKNKSFRRLG